MRRIVAAVLLSALAGGCATTKTPLITAYPIERIHRISVIPFDGPGGQIVTNAMIKQLLTQGFEVVDPLQASDAVLKGTVTDYKPTDTLIVFLGSTQIQTDKGQTVTMDNPILSFNGSQVTTENAALSLPTSQVVAQHATVGVAASLFKPHSNQQLWTNDATYEAIDVAQATDTVASALAQSLHQLVWAAHQKDSNG